MSSNKIMQEGEKKKATELNIPSNQAMSDGNRQQLTAPLITCQAVHLLWTADKPEQPLPDWFRHTVNNEVLVCG